MRDAQGRLGRGGSTLKTADRGGVLSHRVLPSALGSARRGGRFEFAAQHFTPTGPRPPPLMVPPSTPMSLRTPSLRSVPHYVSPLSGHAILCSQGKWGRGAHPLVYTGVVLSLVSEGGLKVRIFYFLLINSYYPNY